MVVIYYYYHKRRRLIGVGPPLDSCLGGFVLAFLNCSLTFITQEIVYFKFLVMESMVFWYLIVCNFDVNCVIGYGNNGRVQRNGSSRINGLSLYNFC